MNSKILSLIICYNNEEEVIEYCRMINRLPNSERIEIVIAINSLSKQVKEYDFIENIKQISKNIYVYSLKKNMGYLNGMLEGYRLFAKSQIDEIKKIKWVIMGNTDIKIKSYDVINYLLKCSSYPEDVVCIAPKVHRTMPDCFEHQIEERFKKSKFIFLSWINKIYILSKIYGMLAQKRKTTRLNEDNKPRKIYAAHGCFFIIRIDFIKIFFDENWPFLMYNEEGYISDLIYKNNFSTYYDPYIYVEHQGSTSTRYLTSKQKSLMLAETYKFLSKRY